MKIKIIAAATLLLTILVAHAMNEEKLFWQAVEDKKYEDVKSFLDYNPSLIDSTNRQPLVVIITTMYLNDLDMFKIFLSHIFSRNTNIIYGHHRSLKSPIYRSVFNNQKEMVQALLDCHTTNGEPEDLNEYGFYGKETLEVVKSDKTDPAIKLAFKELQERKKRRDDSIKIEHKRLQDFVEVCTEYADIMYLVSVQRNKS